MTRTASIRERERFGEHVEVAAPATREELGDVVAQAEAAGRPVVAAGLGAHGMVGAGRADTLVVSTAHLTDVAKYEPDDFTIGVEAGMPLAELRALLAANGQELPVDLGGDAAGTVGGLVARAPAWPRLHPAGSLSALLLGAEGVRGGGIPFRSGGMVVKNVAGYQVHKLMVGSHGRLGIVTRANFRLRPIPARRLVRFAAGDAAAVDALAAALRERGPEPVLAVLRGGAVGAVRGAGVPVPDGEAAVAWLFEGRAERVAWQAGRADAVAADASVALGDAVEQEDAARALDALVTLADPPPDAARVVLRASLLPSRCLDAAAELVGALTAADAGAAVSTDPQTGVVHAAWTPSGGRGDTLAVLDEAAAVVRRHDGVPRVLCAPSTDVPSDGVLSSPSDAAVADTVRAVFDPRGTFAAAAPPAPAEAAPETDA